MKKSIFWGIGSLLLHSQGHAVAESTLSPTVVTPALSPTVVTPALSPTVVTPKFSIETLTIQDKLKLLKGNIPSIVPQIVLGTIAVVTFIASLSFLKDTIFEDQKIGNGIITLVAASAAIASSYYSRKKYLARKSIKEPIQNIQRILADQITSSFVKN